MIVKHLSLTNFRNYGRLELDFPVGVTVLHGANAQGKTNILEAIYYLATTRSPRAESDHQLIHWDARIEDEPIVVARLMAQIERQGEPIQLEMRLIQELSKGALRFRREALVNRRKVRLMDLLGNLRVVLFLPNDVEMIRSSPAVRRRYLDIALCQLDQAYCRTLSAYNKVVEQRNAALKQVAETGRGRDVLPILSQDLVRYGSEIFGKRARYTAELAEHTQRIHYESLTDGLDEAIRLGYLPRLVKEKPNSNSASGIDVYTEYLQVAEHIANSTDNRLIEEKFDRVVELSLDRDLSAGVTTVGPHRDDWRFWINGRSLSSFGSRGQQRSALLALKLAEIELMRQRTNDSPLLLLDEVVAELDDVRRELLLQTISGMDQAVLTSTDLNMFPAPFLESAVPRLVENGRIIQFE